MEADLVLMRSPAAPFSQYHIFTINIAQGFSSGDCIACPFLPLLSPAPFLLGFNHPSGSLIVLESSRLLDLRAVEEQGHHLWKKMDTQAKLIFVLLG